jgi:ABC-type microcin C transport system permease subunit YejB
MRAFGFRQGAGEAWHWGADPAWGGYAGDTFIERVKAAIKENEEDYKKKGQGGQKQDDQQQDDKKKEARERQKRLMKDELQKDWQERFGADNP